MTRPEDLAVMRARLFPAASTLLFVAVFADAAHADQLSLEGGLYEITSRLELPHLERWAIDQTMSICVSNGTGMRGDFPLPCSPRTMPLRDVWLRMSRGLGPASNTISFALDGAVQSEGDLHARAREFRGRISMTMGAKNMTMTEVQIARRLGGCAVADTRRN